MNNINRVHLPPIQDMLYHRPLHSDTGTHSLYKKLPSPNSKHYENRAHASRDNYNRYSPQNQSSPDYYHNNNQRLSPYHHKDSAGPLGPGDTTIPAASKDWEERSADVFRKQNVYIDCSKLDETSATSAPRNYRATVPLQQEQNAQRTFHSRSFSDQLFLRRSSASDNIARRLLYTTSAVDPPRSFHRRTASDIPSPSNIERQSFISNSNDQKTQDCDTFENEQSRSPPPSKIININRYRCNACFKSFSRPSSLRIHVLSHTGEKPHACPQPDCGRRFSVQSNMRRHLKVHYCNPTQQRQQQHETVQTFSSRLQQL